jgi:pantothenate kinase type III
MASMYERFTDRARKVMVLANQEAQRFNHEYIGTEHILLGLIKEGSGVAANVLKNLGVDLRRIRMEVEKLVQSGPDMLTLGKLPQTPRAKKVVEYAIAEAHDLGHNYLGTEHLLLGLLREKEGVAAQVLINLGLGFGEVRDETLRLLGNPPAKRSVENRAHLTNVLKRMVDGSTASNYGFPPWIARGTTREAGLVAVDVGNSQMKLGFFPDDDRCEKKRSDLLVEPSQTFELPIIHENGLFEFKVLSSWCEQQLTGDARWLVGSVHRSAGELLGALIGAWIEQSDLNWSIRQLTYSDIPVAIHVDEPARVGIDRLLAAVAANRLRTPGRAAIVVDLGTAITVDLVEADGAFAGGAILPGIGMAGRALADQTDALPHIVLEHSATPPSPVGKSTKAAIEAGLYWGAVGAVGELVAQLSKNLPMQPDIFITGGAGRSIADSMPGDSRVRYVPHLVLSGIALIDDAAGGGNQGSAS